MSSERRAIDLPLRAPRQNVPPLQLSGPEESGPATRQLTRTSESPRATSQLYRGGRTAQPAAPLSTPREGRTGAIEVVEGQDRCDPEAPGDRRGPECARVIETRAAEFRSPEPVKLSPEQRLLGEQRTPMSGTAEAAARRLAINAADPNSMEDQSIAAIVLRDRPAPTQPTEEAPVEEVSPVIQAIVGAIAGDTPRRP